MSPGWSFQAVQQPAPPTPSANLTLTDPATWVAILTTLAAVVINAWPKLNLAPLVPSMSIVVAGIVASVVMFSKHHYAAGIAQATGAAAAAGAALPKDASPDLERIAGMVAQVNTALSAMVAGGVTPNRAPAPPPGPLPVTSPPVQPGP